MLRRPNGPSHAPEPRWLPLICRRSSGPGCRAQGNGNGNGSGGGPPSAACRAERNGGGLPSAAAAAEAPGRSQLDELAALVRDQRRLIKDQRRALDDLSRRLEQQQAQHAQPSAAAAAAAAPPATEATRWPPPPGAPPSAECSPPAATDAALAPDRRKLGRFDARFHSTRHGATPPLDFRSLPPRIVLVRHAESAGNVDREVYARVPDPLVPLTPRGRGQARRAGRQVKALLERAAAEAGGGADGRGGEGGGGGGGDPGNYRVFFLASPYKRAMQTCDGLRAAFGGGAQPAGGGGGGGGRVRGFQEEVHLREQDFGSGVQDPPKKEREKAQRLAYGRFWFRFEGGESGADVYDRMSLFIDRLVRDINAGRFAAGEAAPGLPPPPETSLVLVSHGLALRVFLMRWLGWSVDEFLRVYNLPNATPIVLERMDVDAAAARAAGEGVMGAPAAGGGGLGLPGAAPWVHTQALYRLSAASLEVLRGCTPSMAVNQTVMSSDDSDEEEDEEGGGGGGGGGDLDGGGQGEEEEVAEEREDEDVAGADADESDADDGARARPTPPPYNDFFYGP